MVATIVDGDTNVGHRCLDETALLEHRAEALVARRNELTRDDATLNEVDELVLLLVKRLDKADNATELA